MNLKKMFSSTVSCEASPGAKNSETTHTGAVSAAKSSLDAVYKTPAKAATSTLNSSTPLVYRYRYSNGPKSSKKRPRSSSTGRVEFKAGESASIPQVQYLSDSYSSLNCLNNNVVIMGAGRLGQSLVGFRSQSSSAIKVVGVFDNDPRKIGLAIGASDHVIVESEEKLPHRVLEHGVRRGIIAVPPLNAQDAANALVKAGVRLILNYAPVNIEVPQNVHIERIDPAVQFSRLAVPPPIQRQSSLLKSIFRFVEINEELGRFECSTQAPGLRQEAKVDNTTCLAFNATRAIQVLFWQFPLTLEYSQSTGTQSIVAREKILLEQLPMFGTDAAEEEWEEYDSFFSFLLAEKERSREQEEKSVSSAFSSGTSTTFSTCDRSKNNDEDAYESDSSKTDLSSSKSTSYCLNAIRDDSKAEVSFGEQDESKSVCEQGSQCSFEDEQVASARVRPSSADFGIKNEGSLKRSSSAPSFGASTIHDLEALPEMFQRIHQQAAHEIRKEASLALGCSQRNSNKVFEIVAERWRVKTRPSLRFEDVVGLDDTKASLKEFFARDGVNSNDASSSWRSMLLYGPPGCGKSMIASAAMGEMFSEFVFFSVSATDLIVSHASTGGPSLCPLFQYASECKSEKAVVVFIDNVDQLCNHKHLKAELLQQLDALRSNRVLLLSATNIPWDIDISLFRHFEKKSVVPLPDASARRQIFKRCEALSCIASKDAINRLAAATANYSGSDLLLVIKDALMQPKRRQKEASDLRVTDFIRSTQLIRPTLSREILKLYNSFGKKFGREETDIRHLNIYS